MTHELPDAPLLNYPKLFKQYVVRSIRTSLSGLEDNSLSSQETRDRALHVLSFALQLEDAWTDTCELLLRMAPMMEKAGHRDDWLSYLEGGVRRCRLLEDEFAEAQLNLEIGMLHQLRSRYDDAYARYTISQVYFEKVSDTAKQAKAINRMAFVAYLQSRYVEATTLAEKALHMLHDDDAGRAASYNVLGRIAFDNQDWQQAVDYFQKALELREKENDPRMVAQSLRDLGPALRASGKYVEAIICHERAIALFAATNDLVQQAVTQMNLGTMYLFHDQPAQALNYYQLAEPIFRKTQDELHLGIVHTNLGIAHRQLQHRDRAEHFLLLAIRRWESLGRIDGLVNTMDELGLLFLEQGLLTEAETIFEDALNRLAQIEHKPSYEHYCKSLTTHLEIAKRKAA